MYNLPDERLWAVHVLRTLVRMLRHIGTDHMLSHLLEYQRKVCALKVWFGTNLCVLRTQNTCIVRILRDLCSVHSLNSLVEKERKKNNTFNFQGLVWHPYALRTQRTCVVRILQDLISVLTRWNNNTE